jgi:hypothetical protein
MPFRREFWNHNCYSVDIWVFASWGVKRVTGRRCAFLLV